ncbi:putative UDP-glucose 4-epimerase [Holospora obtusa F1]|uniref:UDP-glucose 4-epimerase n=1 Tax=Holospora obtusa F1 TaxID=1399147 RepID=W6TTP1_HOLOB|nr:NAD-dependent epimerase/dehydratase family protein [Holospora obtusa]ETZ07157.1 putative UDP-glucose 4-epimerase [Holospora obtusa F1]
MRFQGQKILVIGGSGFVGSNLCYQLLQEGVHHLTVVDNLLSAQAENLPKNEKVDFVFGSISDDRILMSLAKDYDYVFHLATYHGNQSSIHDPLADHENNTITTLKVCEHFKGSSHLKKMVYSSAGCTVAKKTYDDVGATNEDAEVSSYHDSPYQISKIIGEFYGNYYWMKYQLPFVKARFQNVYGPREVLGAGSWRGIPATVWRNVTPTFIWKALHQEELPLENEGKASRDFIYVDDIVEGLIACAVNGKAGEVYNLASGYETTIKELAEAINRLTNNPTPILYTNPRPWDRSGKRFGSTEKAQKDLGFIAKTSLEDGLDATIKWTKENRLFILANISKHLYFMPELSKYL